jgi:iron(II)-dependent oxidoreductase
MTTAADLVGALEEARERTLAIVAPLTDTDVESVHNPLMSPLVWDLAHIAAYEDLWIGHRFGDRPLLRPELASMYDAFDSPRRVRGSLPLLDREGALGYLEETRSRSLEVLAERGDGDLALVELVLRHEHQHDETMLQAIELARLDRTPDLPGRPRPEAAGAPSGLQAVEIPGGPCTIGAPAGGFAYDNERPQVQLDLGPFAIGRHPVTNADFAAWVDGGGYERREWWSDEGWAWRISEGADAPGGWRRTEDGWQAWRIDGEAPLAETEPVVHISFFEAEAFARAHGARLPTEPEWEKAATWDPDAAAARPFPWGDEPPAPRDHRANLDHDALGPLPAGALDGASPHDTCEMIGDVWEWTSSDFAGYPGFVAHPYREYSEVFFGQGHKVLRGGSWATRARVASPTFRNWDLPQRRQIFSGLRLAWDRA